MTVALIFLAFVALAPLAMWLDDRNPKRHTMQNRNESPDIHGMQD